MECLEEEVNNIEKIFSNMSNAFNDADINKRIWKIKFLCIEKVRKRDFHKEGEFAHTFKLINKLSVLLLHNTDKMQVKRQECAFFDNFNTIIEPIFRAEYLDQNELHDVFIEILTYFSMFSHIFPEITMNYPHSLAFSMSLLRILASDEINKAIRNEKIVKMLEIGTKIFTNFVLINYTTFNLDWSPTLAVAVMLGLDNSQEIIFEKSNIYISLFQLLSSLMQFISLKEAFFQEKIMNIIVFHTKTIKILETDFFFITKKRAVKSIIKLFNPSLNIIKVLSHSCINEFILYIVNIKPSWQLFSLLSIAIKYSDIKKETRIGIVLKEYIEKCRNINTFWPFKDVLDYLTDQLMRKHII